MPQDPAIIAAIAIAGLAALGIAFLVGRRTGGSARQIGELQTRVEELGKQREILQAEVSAARDAASRARDEFEGYREQVADHFSGTSDLLREMTQQYRAVYAHLSRGASSLCPEGFVGLEPGAGPGALAEGSEADPESADSADGADATDETDETGARTEA